MASKRRLKKDFCELALMVYEEAVFTRWIIDDPKRKDAITQIMDDIQVWTDDTLRRIIHTDGSKNAKLVKQYYKNLRIEIEDKVDYFLDKILE